MDKWIKRPFLIKANSDNLIGNIRFSSPKVVMRKAQKGSWDEWGLHDPVILCDNEGHSVEEDGAMVMYYSGACGTGETQGMGRAISLDGGHSWRRDPDKAVLAPQANAWDNDVASNGWVIKDDDLYRIYYRGSTLQNTYRDAIGYAECKDGVNFQRPLNRPIIEASMYKDIEQSQRKMMGAINVIKTLEKKYLLTFEAYSVSCDGRCQIYGALSDDGINFKPFNDGYPIFTYKNVKSWPVIYVANPRITVIDETKTYMLTFNGSHNYGYYSLGIAYSKDLLNWEEHSQNPILLPTGYPVEHPFSGRLEGAVFIKEDLLKNDKNIRCYYIAIPRKGPSHHNSGISLIEAEKTGSLIENYHFPGNNREDITFIEDDSGEILEIKKKDESIFPTSVHFLFKDSKESVDGVSFKVKLSRGEKDVFMHLNNRPSFLDTSDGVKIRITDDLVKLFKTGSFEIYKKIIRRLYLMFPKLMIDCNKIFRWKTIGKIKEEDWVNFEILNDSREISIKINGKKIGVNKIVNSFKIRCLSFICKDGTIKIKDVAYRVQKA